MKPKNIKGILVYFIFPASLGQFPLWPIGIERYLDRFQVNRNRYIGSESDYCLLRLPQPPVYFFKLVYFLKITQGPTRFLMEILEGVIWQTSQADYNGPKQQ